MAEIKEKYEIFIRNMGMSYPMEEIRTIIVLISIMGSYWICCYLASFDNRYEDNLSFLIVFYALDAVFLVDTFFNIRLLKKTRKTDVKMKISKACILPVLIDIISLIPIEVVVLSYILDKDPQPDSLKIIHSTMTTMEKKALEMKRLYSKTALAIIAFSRLNRLLRLYRFGMYYGKKTHELRINMYTREVIALLICFSCFLIVLFHGVACIWYSLNCHPVFMDEPPDCEGAYLNDDDNSTFGFTKDKLKQKFYEHVNFSAPDAWGWYIGALHWSVQSIRNSGNSQSNTANSDEKKITYIVIMLAGYFLSGAILIVAIYIMGHLDLRRSIFFHEALGVNNFVKHFNMGRHITTFLNSSFNYMWHNRRGYSDDTMKSLLPKSLRTEISMEIFNPMINASELLKFLNKEALEALSLQVQYKHYFSNEFIIRPNTVGSSMYYIVEGSVEIISDEDGITPILSLSKGSLLGELNLIFPTYRKCGVKTSAACDILKLSCNNVIPIVQLYPQTLAKMRKVLKERMRWQTRLTFTEKGHQKPTENQQDSVFGLLSQVYRSSKSTSMQLQPKQTVKIQKVSGVRSEGDIGKRSRTRNLNKTSFKSFRPVNFNWGVTETQFLSVLAWLNFHARDKDRKVQKVNKYADLASQMKPNCRNVASNQFYQVLPLITIPKYYLERLVISRETSIFLLWDVFVTVVITVYIFVYPFELVFHDNKIWSYFNTAVDLTFLFDVVFRLIIFLDPSEMAPLTSGYAHFCHEIQSVSIWFDAIPVIPLHNLKHLMQVNQRGAIFLRLNVCVKFVKLVMRFRRWENNVNLSTICVRIIKHIIYISLFIVWVASVIIMFKCPVFEGCEFKSSTSPLSKKNFSFSTQEWNYIEIGGSGPIQTDRYQFEQDSLILIFLYWAACVAFGIGFTDIKTLTKKETSLHTGSLLIGFCLLAYCCSDLAATLSGAIENKIHHQDNILWLQAYLDEALIELQVIKRVHRYLEIQWLVLRGLSSKSNIHSVGFLSVSHTMYNELMVHIVAECLSKTYLFQHMDADIMRTFCLTSKIAVVPPGEEVISHRDIIRRMYIIRRGFAEVFYGDTVFKIGILSAGQSFGEVNLLYGVPSRVMIRSVSYLEVIVVDSNAFEKMLPTSKVLGEVWNSLRSNQKALASYQRHFDVLEAVKLKRRSHTSHQLESPQVYVYRRVKRRLGMGNMYKKGWNRLGICRYLRFCMCRMTFLPFGYVLKAWEVFRLLTIILMTFGVPLLEAFPSLKEKYGTFIYIVDGVTVFDMVIRLHVAYYDSKTNELKTHPLSTAMHYFSTSFFADLLGSPLVYHITDIIIKVYAPKWFDFTVYAYLLRLNRLILLYHVWGFYKFFEASVTRGQNLWKIVKLVPFLFFHAHIMACLLAVNTCPAKESYHDGPRCKSGTWISLSRTYADPITVGQNRTALDLHDIQIYIFCFYYVATTTVGCGFGDFLPANATERTFSAILFFCYIFVLSYIMASVAGSKCHMDYKLLRYQKKMDYLVGYLSREKIDSRCTSRIIRHYDHQWLRTKGIEPQKLFSNLFPSLRKEVALNVFEDVMGQIPEFDGAPLAFLRAVCVYLSPVYYLENDIIIRQGDICDTIYFIFLGKVVATSDEKLVSKELGEGGLVGCISPFEVNPKYDFTVSAITNVDMFAIRKKDFDRIVKAFPQITDRFTTSSLDLFKNTEFLEEGTNQKLEREGTVFFPQSEYFSRTRESTNISNDHVTNEVNDEDDSIEVITQRPLERQTLHEVAVVVVEREIQGLGEDITETLYIQYIQSHSRATTFLNVIIFLAAVLSSCLTCYQAAFKEFQLESKLAISLYIVGYLCDFVYILKMIFGFRMSFYDQKGEIITDVTEIANKYLSLFGFVWDFVSTFPLELMATIQLPLSLMLCSVLRLNRIMRLLHVWTFFRKRMDNLLVNLLRVKLERLVVCTLVYLHIAACILQTYTNISRYYTPARTSCTSTIHNGSNITVCWPNNWVYTEDFSETKGGSTKENSYVLTMYFILSTFTTTAYGDITPVTYFEMIFTSVLALSSKIWLGLALSDILSGIQNSTDVSFHLAADAALRLYQDYGVSPEILRKTEKYFLFAWIQNKGVVIPEFILRAPQGLKMDICTAVYGEHFRKSYIFRDLPESFIRQICVRLKHGYILHGDIVVSEKEIDDVLYVVHRGVVAYYRVTKTPVKRPKKDYGFLTKGQYFGESQGILGPQQHKFTFKAESNVDILSLSHSDLQEIFLLFPTSSRTILKRLHNKSLVVLLDLQKPKTCKTEEYVMEPKPESEPLLQSEVPSELFTVVESTNTEELPGSDADPLVSPSDVSVVNRI